MAEGCSSLSALTLNLNGLNSPINKAETGKQILKTMFNYTLSIRDSSVTNRLKVKEWESIFYANSNQKMSKTAILISNKIEFCQTCLQRQRRALYMDKMFSPSRI